MRRPTVRSLAAALVSVALFGSVVAAAPAPVTDAVAVALGPGSGIVQHETGEGPATYVVVHQAPPLALYDGRYAGLAATMPALRGAADLDTDGPLARAYLRFVDVLQDRLVTAISAALGTRVEPSFRYRTALNGVALELTPAQAAAVAELPGVARVVRETPRHLTTDTGPKWIGADTVWQGASDETMSPNAADRAAEATGKRNVFTALPGFPGTKGEGVVVGVIDTGINHDHPSFADVGDDGYDHENPRDRYYGFCAVAATPLTGACNDKLIGIYDFTATGPEDDQGHGSHTASTAAGNVVDATLATPTVQFEKRLSGVAPHANIISYKGCSGSLVGCPLPSLVMAIEQATLDEVDVINYSIGGGSTDPWTDLDALAFLGARAAGIFVATSAGNEGPGPSTVGSPADAPWVTTVAASTHDRKLFNALTDLENGVGSLPDIEGASLTAGLAEAPIVYAGDHGNALCGEGTDTVNPTNPWAGERPFEGKIVVCDRGTYGRVAKAQVVADAGAAGYVLANDEASGDSLVGDAYPIPGVHISYDDGLALKEWLAQDDDGATAAIQGTTFDVDPANGDVMASFSSRGPNPASGDLLKPDITGPGVDILAAYSSWGPAEVPLLGPVAPPIGPVPTDTDPEYGVMSGTSMSSPHLAGAAALMTSLRPEWTPDQIKSALMTTAFDGSQTDGDEIHPVLKEDATTPTDPFDRGAGRAALERAAFAALTLDVEPADYLAANPLLGGDPGALNVASIAESACASTCTWSRTVTNVSGRTLTWDVAAELEDMPVEVTPQRFTLADGESRQIDVTVDAQDLIGDDWRFGTVRLLPDADAPTTTLTLAVRPAEAAPAPSEADGEPAQPPISGSVLVPAPGVGVIVIDGVTQAYFEFVVEEGWDNAHLEVDGAVTPLGDVDLYLQKLEGEDWSGDLAEGVSASLAGEQLSHADPEPGRYRVRVHNWLGGPVQVELTVTFFNSDGEAAEADEGEDASGDEERQGWRRVLL